MTKTIRVGLFLTKVVINWSDNRGVYYGYVMSSAGWIAAVIDTADEQTFLSHAKTMFSTTPLLHRIATTIRCLTGIEIETEWRPRR